MDDVTAVTLQVGVAGAEVANVQGATLTRKAAAELLRSVADHLDPYVPDDVREHGTPPWPVAAADTVQVCSDCGATGHTREAHSGDLGPL